MTEAQLQRAAQLYARIKNLQNALNCASGIPPEPRVTEFINKHVTHLSVESCDDIWIKTNNLITKVIESELARLKAEAEKL